METKKGLVTRAGLSLLGVILVGFGAWVFGTIDSLQGKVSEMEAKEEKSAFEQKAQWDAIRRTSQAQLDQQVELLVTKRIFELLLDQNRIAIDKVYSKYPSASKPEGTDDFRDRQIMQYKQDAKE